MSVVICFSLFPGSFVALTFVAGLTSEYAASRQEFPNFEAGSASTTTLKWSEDYIRFDLGDIKSPKDPLYVFDAKNSSSMSFQPVAIPSTIDFMDRVYGEYDFGESGTWIFVGEAEYDWSTKNQHDAVGRINEDGNGRSAQANITAMAALRARLGYRTGRNVLYATAGPSVIGYDVSASLGPKRSSNFGSEFLWGWTAGLGLERQMSNQWEWNITYKLSNFNSGEASDTFAALENLNIHELSFGFTSNF